MSYDLLKTLLSNVLKPTLSGFTKPLCLKAHVGLAYECSLKHSLQAIQDKGSIIKTITFIQCLIN